MNKVALFAILGTAMFLLSGATAFAASPSSAPVHLQPNPTLNANITWSTYNSSWAPLEYNNGTGMNYLPASPSSDNENPISINTADIQATYMHQPIAGEYYNGTTLKVLYQSATAGAITTTGTNGTTVYRNGNGSAAGAYYTGTEITYPITSLPSNNPAYDYITVEGYLTGADVTGVTAYVGLTNNTTEQYPGLPGIKLYPTGQKEGYYMSVSLAQENLTLNGATGLGIGFELSFPAATTGQYNLTVTGVAITTYPEILGQNSTGAEVSQAIGTAHLSTFKPTNQMNIINNGYSIAVSQPLQNLTATQTPISSGNYIEQVEYQGQFDLPSAPDLSYGPAVLTEQFNVSTAQTQVLDINGVSYLSTITGKNGTIQLLGSVNPNSQTQFLQIVDYTQSQWNSISVAPGIFTIAGIEYYWWIAVGGLATLIGLAAAAKHAGTKADQERIRRGR